MTTALIICVTVILAVVFITMAVDRYHQMLLINEVNKRLLLIATESIEKERVSAEELKGALDELDRLSSEPSLPEQPTASNEDFNAYHDQDLDL